MIKNYLTYIKENQNAPVDGRFGFYMFLHSLDELKFTFIKTGDYLNVGNFEYFFRTEIIKNQIDVLDNFEFKESNGNTFRTYEKIKDERLSFYFGIRNGILEFGFYNDMTDIIYKTGQFEIKDRELRTIKSYKCLVLINGVLNTTNTRTLKILHDVKKDLKNLFPDIPNKGITILTIQRLRKMIPKDQIKEKDLEKYFSDWCSKFSWVKKVESYIDDSEDIISFYVKIKPKKNEPSITL